MQSSNADMRKKYSSLECGLPGCFALSFFILLLVLLLPRKSFALSGRSQLHSITISAPAGLLDNTITRTTIEDVLALLKKGFPKTRVTLNSPGAEVMIILPPGKGDGSIFQKNRTVPFSYPHHEYQWESHCRGKKVVLRLTSPSFQGISFGLYGLLQQKLGFKFYHPRRTIVPSHTYWPLPCRFQWQAVPRFDKKGFHLHTQHPIELTEQLHNPDYPGALADLREYIDWLVRNGQNTVQFYLLRDIDRERWIRHIGSFVDYAHKRGILAGVEISLCTLQQKAFQTINPLNILTPYTTQIDKILSWLFSVQWDFVTVDFTMGEYLPDLGRRMPGVKAYMIGQITEKYKTALLYPTHVIPEKHSPEKLPCSPGPAAKTGILIHTVMCYSISEPSAPVYGNANQRSMLKRAAEECGRQETWYWPESSYWVAFDTSVPLLLLPYLDARWSDMNVVKSMGIDNHLTFSSGWEWGYWLIDWSIARWSWTYSEGGKMAPTSPLDAIHDLLPGKRVYRLYEEALILQNVYLKKRRLIALLAALDPSAELPWPFDSPFQPRPDFTYPWLLRHASDKEVQRVLEGPVADLEAYASKMDAVVDRLEREAEQYSPLQLSRELIRGLRVTALRAQHRALTIKALIARRNGQRWQTYLQSDSEQLLQQAASVRKRAMDLVLLQERMYRYPVELIARSRQDFTAYHFGYLYPASNLFFWKREEEQIRNERFDAFYLNIWNFWRIAGLESLFRCR